MHIGYVPRERPPFSALNFRSGAYHFHKFLNNPLRSITILQFLPFRRPYFRCPRLAYSAELAPEPSTFTPEPLKLAPEPCIFHFAAGCSGVSAGQSASQTHPTVRSGDPHFHAQLPRARSGAPHFHALAPRARSGAQHSYARARSGAPHFSLCPWHIPTKIWGEYPPPPPPPPPGGISYNYTDKLYYDKLYYYLN